MWMLDQIELETLRSHFLSTNLAIDVYMYIYTQYKIVYYIINLYMQNIYIY